MHTLQREGLVHDLRINPAPLAVFIGDSCGLICGVLQRFGKTVEAFRGARDVIELFTHTLLRLALGHLGLLIGAGRSMPRSADAARGSHVLSQVANFNAEI
jgi:hypothetical protein